MSTLIATLLQLALSLLMSAQSNPAITAAQQQQAISTATQAIQFAEESLSGSSPQFGVTSTAQYSLSLSANWYWTGGNVIPYSNFAQGYSYSVGLNLDDAPPNSVILFYLQRPDGTMKYNGVSPVGLSGIDTEDQSEISGLEQTNSSGTWSAASTIQIPASAQAGTWEGWVSVDGALSNKIDLRVAAQSIPPLPPLPSSAVSSSTTTSTPPVITVLSPKGSEQWVVGNQYPIQYAIANPPTSDSGDWDVITTINCATWQLGYADTPINTHTLSTDTGSFVWTIPSRWQGDQCKAEVTLQDFSPSLDLSDDGMGEFPPIPSFSGDSPATFSIVQR